MIETIYGLLIAGLYVLLFRFMMSDDSSESARFRQTMNMEERIKKLENEARYIADQPQQGSYFSNQHMTMHFDALQNAYAMQPNVNEVPINDVVKAIVKHLDMQIEKVAEQTTKTPQEVKVVEKPKATGKVLSADGTGTTWVSPAQPKAKRKYTKRKTK